MGKKALRAAIKVLNICHISFTWIQTMEISELIDNFELLDDWEDKYRYIIDLGSKIEPLEKQFYQDEWKVRGCQSQVWLVPEKKDGRLYFKGDSDAAIVKGIVFIVLSIFSGKTPDEIKQIDINDIFNRLGLHEHLSPSRRNGLTAMTEKILHYANVL